MNPIERVLEAVPVMVLDGALATELERRGADLADPLWSARVLMDDPGLIEQVHADYFAAGADCAITATYQATFQGFARRGVNRAAAADLMHLAVALAVRARDRFWAHPTNRMGRPRPLVAASVGSYGAYLADGSEYRGDYGLTVEELMAFHRPRMALLAASSADVLACETVPCLLEARALARLLREFPGRTAWISFSARDGLHTCHGESIDECARELDGYEQVTTIGVNCTPPGFIADLVAAIRTGTGKPILVYPNSGEAYLAGEGCWTGQGDEFVAYAPEWAERGARIIGGCCRTTPEQIAALSGWARGL